MKSKVFEVQCNGYNFGCHLLNYLKPVIVPHIAEHRKAFKLVPGMYGGGRFHSDDSVFTRIASALYDYQLEPPTLTPEEITHLINSALSDCARSDHWYMFEKDYG